MNQATGSLRRDAVLYFDRLTSQFLVVCEPHGVSYSAETTFDARLLVDTHNTSHADVTSDLYLREPGRAESKAETLGRLLTSLRTSLGLTVECSARLAAVSAAEVVAAEGGRIQDGPVQRALSTTYSAVAAGLSNADHAWSADRDEPPR